MPALAEHLGRLRAALIDAGERLGDAVDETTRQATAPILEGIRGQISQIAVVGQMKAGKSTLINGFVRTPGLLPADVNPWTGVITNLHFGLPDGRRQGGIFQFFTEDEWQELIEGGGQVGIVLRRLGLEAEAADASRDAEQLGRRAQRMLGERFACLLGKQHRFKSLAADTLAEYVSMGDAGHDDDVRLGKRPGRFACITKTADVFLDDACFGIPTTVTDTPGTNDPFLSRGELTRQAIGTADVYIVVLNCRQALSVADLDLLRLLYGLHKSRVVVFINRIDLLNDVVAESELVARHVRAKLEHEFPGIGIPVIAGSALWAEQALDPAINGQVRAAPRLAALARHGGLVGPADERTLAAGIVGPELKAVMYRCSGLPLLNACVAELMTRGPWTRSVARGCADLASIADWAAVAGRDEARALGEAAMERHASAGDTTERVAEIELEKQRLEDLMAEIESFVQTSARSLALRAHLRLMQLGDTLGDAVTRFRTQSQAAMRAAIRRRPRHVWRCETKPLLAELERLFLDSYDRVVRELRAAEQAEIAEFSDKLAFAVRGYKLAIKTPAFPAINPTPSLAALSETSAFYLTKPWTAWWKLWRSPEDKANRLGLMIEQEFGRLTDGLIKSAAGETDAHLAGYEQRLVTVGRNVLNHLLRQHRELLERLEHPAAAADGRPAASAAEPEVLEQRRRRLLEQAAQAEGLLDWLSRLRGELESLLEAATPARH